MPRIFDVFMFRDELDMLECRLRELDSRVHRHVLVEAPVTHRGDPKPLWYAENKDRFAAWGRRIVHVVADLPDGLGPWQREHAQRDAAMPALAAAAADDLVLIADVDEIPSASALAAEPAGPVALRMRLAMYAVDWLYPDEHVCSVLAPAGTVGGSLAGLRDQRSSMPVLEDGGWHLTWLGGVEAQRAKLAVTCHTEMTGWQAALIASGRCYYDGAHHSGNLQMVPADVDETWPGPIARGECPPSWFRPRAAA